MSRIVKRDEEGVREAAVWWGGGTEPENCIACLVISLPPGSYSSPPLTVQVAPHLWYLFLPVFVSPLWPSPHPSSSPLATSLCHFAVLPSRLLSSTFSAVISARSAVSAARSSPPSSSCADLALASLLSPGLGKCKLPPNLQAKPWKNEREGGGGVKYIFGGRCMTVLPEIDEIFSYGFKGNKHELQVSGGLQHKC